MKNINTENMYVSYDLDRNTDVRLKIEHSIYTDNNKIDISKLKDIPINELKHAIEEKRKEIINIINDINKKAKEWERVAGQMLVLNDTLKYISTEQDEHTNNKWIENEYGVHTISNKTYKMVYRIYDRGKYDSNLKKWISYSWDLEWNLYLNTPKTCGIIKIAGQKKTFKNKEAMEKYLNGRIKYYSKLFTEECPPVPKEYVEFFTMYNQLLPGYRLKEE